MASNSSDRRGIYTSKAIIQKRIKTITSAVPSINANLTTSSSRIRIKQEVSIASAVIWGGKSEMRVTKPCGRPPVSRKYFERATSFKPNADGIHSSASAKIDFGWLRTRGDPMQ